jgi:hypothetical protein
MAGMRRYQQPPKGRVTLARVAPALVAAILLGSVTYALTASNTVAANRAGSGSNTIGKYAFTSASYTLNANSPQLVDSVTFTLDSPAETVKARLAATGSYSSCTNTSGNTWTCPSTGTFGTSVNPLPTLSVAAAQ